jgi:hypothetical protein
MNRREVYIRITSAEVYTRRTSAELYITNSRMNVVSNMRGSVTRMNSGELYNIISQERLQCTAIQECHPAGSCGHCGNPGLSALISAPGHFRLST